jgi:hypothetical protein
MNIITEVEMNLERLSSLFQSNNLPAEIIEVYPAVKEWNLAQDAYLQVNYPESISLIIWLDQFANKLLRMRIVILPSNEMKKISKDDLLNLAADVNQQISCFGTLDVMNLLGVTLEYPLPYHEAILEHTVLVAAERLVRGASAVFCDLELRGFKYGVQP